MGLQMVAPLTVRLTLTDGAWIEIKEQLNHGEHQHLLETMYVVSDRGELVRQPHRWSNALLTAYLVDWSAPISIRGRPTSEIQDALNNLDQDSYSEIQEAIEGHANRLAELRAEKKRARSGSPASAPTSLSLVGVTGDTSGSAN